MSLSAKFIAKEGTGKLWGLLHQTFQDFLSGFTHTDPDHYVRQLMNNAGYCVKMAPRAFIKNGITFTKVSYIVSENPSSSFLRLA